MKFGIFYEHQLPRPWTDNAEQRLFNEALEQVEVADKLGIDYAWEVEHHFLEEYSHSSAPEVFLAACAARWVVPALGPPVAPDPALTDRYDALFHAYVDLRKRAAPFWHRLAEIRAAVHGGQGNA